MSDSGYGDPALTDFPPGPEVAAQEDGLAYRLRGQVSRVLLRKALARLQLGSLTVTMPDGAILVHRTDAAGPDAVLNLHRWRTMWRLFVQGDIGFAESYVDGDWSSPDPSAIIELAARNDETFSRSIDGSMPARVMNRLRHARRDNSRAGSPRNIMAHYDLGNAFFAHWLDRDMSYSSGFYRDAGLSLEEAQAAKQDLVIDKLDLKGGERILEIGCGWGSLAERLIRRGCHVTGLTLSPAQRDYAQARLAQAGLADGADFRLQDYRDVTGRFDRVVSVEMFEAVGQRYWPTFFSTLRDRLTAGGTAVLQVITIDDRRFASYARTPDFIQRYIFPGGMLPSPGLMTAEINAAGLGLADVVTFGQSYAETCREWNRRFQRAWPSIEPLGFDLPFKRMWEFYLNYCEGGFRSGATNVGVYALRAP